MRERDLKRLFISSLESGHIYNNNYNNEKFLLDWCKNGCELKIKDEGYFRNFDLVIAVIQKSSLGDSQIDSLELYDRHYNILMRSGLLTKFASSEKCRVDSIEFYPIEIKSDQDVLDDRLTNQILNAVLTFGRSIVVLDEKHSKDKKLYKVWNYLPATVIGYTGVNDHFKVISLFSRFVVSNIYNLEKRSLLRLLIRNGLELRRVEKIYDCLEKIQRINQKIAFSQLNDDENVMLLKEELEFIEQLVNIEIVSDKKLLNNMIKNSINNKITDFI